MTYKRQDAAFKRKIQQRVEELATNVAVEFGYKGCERGWNLQQTLEEARQVRKGRTVFPFKHFGDRVEDKR